jgi:hypothetical protein
VGLQHVEKELATLRLDGEPFRPIYGVTSTDRTLLEEEYAGRICVVYEFSAG